MDVFLYPVTNVSNDVILSDTSILIQQAALSISNPGGGGGGYRSLGNYYHDDDDNDTIDDHEVIRVIEAFLIVRKH